VALLWTATIVRADVFSYSYTGTGLSNQAVTGSGEITATSDGGGFYTITALSGTQNGTSTSLTSGVNLFFDGSSGYGTFDFLLNGSNYALGFLDGGYADAGGLAASAGTFKISSVPEAATISLLLTMGLGVWTLGRKLPSKRQL
jgi:hypothetical protein